MHWEDDENTRDTMMGTAGPTTKELETFGPTASAFPALAPPLRYNQKRSSAGIPCGDEGDVKRCGGDTFGCIGCWNDGAPRHMISLKPGSYPRCCGL